MFVVSDDVLERLICSQCKKYLSVKTIKVYPNRGIKCGRCSDAKDAGVVSLFGVLAEEALFRCVNRFEGCNQLLSYSDVSEHEKYCIGKEYECPCCIEQFKGTAYEINIHFKELHPERRLINNPEFLLEIENELVRSYLYYKNDLLFYVNARYNKGEDELILNIMYLGTDQNASKVTQMFTLHSLDAKIKYKTKRKVCTSVTGGNMIYFRINISPADYAKNIVVCRFDLNTEYVENLVALPQILKKRKQDVEETLDLGAKSSNIITDLEYKSNNIIKPSKFEKGTYPVTVFNPTAPVFNPITDSVFNQTTPVFNPTAPVFNPSASVFNPSSSTWGVKAGCIPVPARVSSLPNATTTTSSIFGNSISTSAVNTNVTSQAIPIAPPSSFSFGRPVTTNPTSFPTTSHEFNLTPNPTAFNFSVKSGEGSNTKGLEAGKKKSIFGHRRIT